MALFGFLKKKASGEIELPPPPSPPEAEFSLPSEAEIPPIRAGMPFEEEIKPEYEKEEVKPEYERAELFPEIPSYEKEEEFEIPSPAAEEEAPRFFDTREALPTREDVMTREIKPMFVAVDEYKNLATNTKVIRARLMEAENHIARLSDIKNQKEKVLARFRSLIEDSEKKISYVDAVIEKAQG